MKKVIVGTFFIAVAILSTLGFTLKSEMNAYSSLNDVEALADCEITKGNDRVILQCKGESKCTDSALGYTLTCDGTKVGN